MLLSIAERVFLLNTSFEKAVDDPLARRILLHQTFPHLWGAANSPMYRDRPRTLNELKTAITAYIRNISQADL
jgi:hypothetical protein